MTPPESHPQPQPERRRRKVLLFVGVLTVLLVGGVLAWALLRGEDVADLVAEAPTAAAPGGGAAGGLAAADLDGDGIVYQSGMHPWIVEDEPGQCPICGMDLQPVSVSGAEEGTVRIDPVTMQNIGVRTAPVAVQALSRDLRATGTFEANERARQAVSLKVGGWVEELYVNAE
ncbi:MAG TPA: heavy metal-binding domain-containing protein, partial [Brevibacterium sp.]|nr:heavy metal-binding domain-containing protein [Brevibacterium sp.]